MKPIDVYGGLFGAFSYDFIDQFEDLPKNENDIIEDPDYYFVLADNLFFIDHSKNELNLVANAFITDSEDIDSTYEKCMNRINIMEKAYYESLEYQSETSSFISMGEENEITTEL